MQKAIRVSETQVLQLATKAKQEKLMSREGYLWKRSSDTGRWQQRYFALYQNMLFYYESDKMDKPSGLALVEGCYCEKIVTVQKGRDKDMAQQTGYAFSIYFKKEGQRQYDLRTETESDCNGWVEAIQQASFSKIMGEKEELQQKHLHLLQILDSERQAKWHYVQQTEELAAEVRKLKQEVHELKEQRSENRVPEVLMNESEELRKIKKVQSFFRGWLCRRRWKQIVEEYIRSEHAESMRKRNSIVFGVVACEEEYVQQLSTLVTTFLRPFKMAASSKKPTITHEDVNSIFLNAETVLFLHQIFLQGLRSKMENWPTLQLGDLFDMLLPMLGIYQEYVRNHHYSMQVLAEYKTKPEFVAILKRFEEKSICESRSMETFLTYPMHQIPRYILSLSDLLAHTPHDHVDRQKLEFAKGKLEELSHIMHDEVSETENIRKNLAIERMIVEGCDILLDVNQIFVRQGSLVQVINEKLRSPKGRLGTFSSSFKESRKETVRQVFLFTNHLIITSRASSGRLHLAKNYGKLALVDCILVEDTTADLFYVEEENGPTDAASPQNLNQLNVEASAKPVDYNGLDFRIVVENRAGPPTTITLVASTLQERAAWCSDISQCIEQLHYTDLLSSSLAETSSVSMPHSIRSDPRLFRDDIDIKFSRTLNSCKVPQIRHATVDRILDRLIDLRFLSIDFLNTFLLTYRVFTDGMTVLNALKKVLKNPEEGNLDPRPSICGINPADLTSPVFSPTSPSAGGNMSLLIKPTNEKARRISTGMMKIEVTGSQQQQQQQQQAQHHQLLQQQQQQYQHQAQLQQLPQLLQRPGTMRTGSLDHSSNMTVTVPSICMSPEVGRDRSLSPPRHSSVPCAAMPIITMVTTASSASPPTSLALSTSPDGQREQTRHRLSTGSVAPKLAPIASCEILPEPSSSSEDEDEPKGKKSSKKRAQAPPKVIMTPTAAMERSVMSDAAKDKDESLQVAHLETRSITMPDMTKDETSTDAAEPEAPEPTPAPAPKKPAPSIASASRRRGVVAAGGSPFSLSADLPDTESAPCSLQASPKRSVSQAKILTRPTRFDVPPIHIPVENILDHTSLQPGSSPCPKRPLSPVRIVSPMSSPKKLAQGSRASSRASSPMSHSLSSPSVVPQACAAPPCTPANLPTPNQPPESGASMLVTSGSPPQLAGNRARASVVSWSSPISTATHIGSGLGGGKRPSAVSCPDPELYYTPRPSIAPSEGAAAALTNSPPCRPRAGAVVTSSRRSKRRSSNTAAAVAFAAATAGTANPPAPPSRAMGRYYSAGAQELKSPMVAMQSKRLSILQTAATMRALNVVRHWVSKFPEDFDNDPKLKECMKSLLEDLVCNQSLQPAEHKAAGNLLKQFLSDSLQSERCKVDLDALLTPVEVPSKENFDMLSAMCIAEQLTYIDHQIFRSISSGELLNQAWMKPDKEKNAKNVLLVSKRFNEISCLVVSEIVSRCDLMDRVACIEKWTAIADICRIFHNYNGVLEICAALVNSSVYRLKRTWEKLPKQTRVTVDRLQSLVSSDGRFKHMREALHRCDPPCIPYLGMYLTDLSFIEEGALNITEDGLVNYCKMRMVAHVIREIQQYQQSPYRIEFNPKVASYLLDSTRLLSEEQTYRRSLIIEPRQSIAGGPTGFGP